MSTSLLLFTWWRKIARRRFKSSGFSFLTPLISSGEWAGAGASACWDAGGGRVELLFRTWRTLWCKVWLWPGEFDQIVNQSHDPNDRCDRVGAEEVSGPVLENTGGPPGRSLQLQVCQWCWKEIWQFEFVDDRRWSSSSKKWYFGWAGNLRKPETRHWYFRWDTDYCFKQLLMTFSSSSTYQLWCAPVPHLQAHPTT